MTWRAAVGVANTPASLIASRFSIVYGRHTSAIFPAKRDLVRHHHAGDLPGPATGSLGPVPEKAENAVYTIAPSSKMGFATKGTWRGGDDRFKVRAGIAVGRRQVQRFFVGQAAGAPLVDEAAGEEDKFE